MPADPIAPDTKDWTWVLERPCPECGYDATGVDLAGLPQAITGNAAQLAAALRRPGAERRTSPSAWSVLEYSAHVRDVHRVFDERLRSMLEQDDPLFASWDQDAAAAEGRYAEQRPDAVAGELVEASEQVAQRYAAVRDEEWERPGRRSNGSVFTVRTLALYHLHDAVHHAHDVATAR